MFETEINHRLMRALSKAKVLNVDCNSAATISSATVAEFARIALKQDFVASLAYAEELYSCGISVETICLELLAPAARFLGTLWDADLCDFTSVTVGLGRLQQVLRALPFDSAPRVETSRGVARILLAPAPGEQHSFGLSIVAEFFLRSGWDVTGGDCILINELSDLVKAEWFDVVGFSVGCAMRVDVLAHQIDSVRRASRNSQIIVIAGGPAVIGSPALVGRLGADAAAVDAKDAVFQAQKLLFCLDT